LTIKILVYNLATTAQKARVVTAIMLPNACLPPAVLMCRSLDRIGTAIVRKEEVTGVTHPIILPVMHETHSSSV